MVLREPSAISRLGLRELEAFAAGADFRGIERHLCDLAIAHHLPRDLAIGVDDEAGPVDFGSFVVAEAAGLADLRTTDGTGDGGDDAQLARFTAVALALWAIVRAHLIGRPLS